MMKKQEETTMIYQDLNRDKQACFTQYLQEKDEKEWWWWAMMAETRDIINGKAEIDATYKWAEILLNKHEEYTLDVVCWMARNVGCWKDIKKWCHDLHEKDSKRYKPTIKSLIHRMNNQLHEDLWQSDPQKRSNIAKWLPRENTRYGGWLYDDLAIDWCIRVKHQPYLIQHMNHACLKKCRRDYRITVSTLYTDYRENTKRDNQTNISMESWIQDVIEQKQPTQLPNCMMPYKDNQLAKNTLVIVIPSSDIKNQKKQVATICQTMFNTGTRKMFIMHKNKKQPQSYEYPDDLSWTQIAQAVWNDISKDPPINSEDEEDILIAFQYFAEKTKSLSIAAKECMTWIWISEFNIKYPIHDTQFETFWKQFIIQEQQQSMPHMVYIATNNHTYTNPTDIRSFPCFVHTPRCTFVTATPNGLTLLQWCELIQKTSSPIKRMYSCWQNIESVLSHYNKSMH